MLELVSPSFTAVVRERDAPKCFGPKWKSLRDRGILFPHSVTELPECVCPNKTEDCRPSVVWSEEGIAFAHCNEWGVPIELESSDVQRYEFRWRKWAEEVRRVNGLSGAGPEMRSGFIYLGLGDAAGRRFRLCMAAPSSEVHLDLDSPEASGKGHGVLVVAYAGSGTLFDPDTDCLSASQLFDDDLLTLRQDVLQKLLELSEPPDRDERSVVVYSNEWAVGREMSSEEYSALRRERSIRNWGFFMDLTRCEAWSGRQRIWGGKSSEVKSNSKIGSQQSAQLLAEFLADPGEPRAAISTKVYKDRAVAPSSATRLLVKVASQAGLGNYLKLHEKGAKSGTGLYVFMPKELTYCLIAPARF